MQIYDCGYKKLFLNKGFFQQLLESFVLFDWVKPLFPKNIKNEKVMLFIKFICKIKQCILL